MFNLRQSTLLLVVDDCSAYVEIAKLDKTTSSDVIIHLRSVFARHSIPEVVVSDNGPQYAAFKFAKFAEEKGYTHNHLSMFSDKAAVADLPLSKVTAGCHNTTCVLEFHELSNELNETKLHGSAGN